MNKLITALILAAAVTTAHANDLNLGMQSFNKAVDLEKSKLYLGACIQYRAALLHFSSINDKKFEKSKDTVRSMEQLACKKAGV